MTFFYSAYGLCLRADLPLPGLAVLDSVPCVDVKVWLDAKPDWLDQLTDGVPEVFQTSPSRNERNEPVLTVCKLAGGDYFQLQYADGTEFVVDRCGKRIWAHWPHPLTLEDTVTYLVGPVLGFVLRLRGVICLHASAVAVGEQAIGLLGSTGAGKSTTAAAFALQGYAVLSDDVAALQERGDAFQVLSGCPRVGLWPDAASALFGSANNLPLLTPNWGKRYLALDENGHRFQREPLPLTAIYVLSRREGDRTSPVIESEPAASGLMTLVSNSYVNLLLDREMRAREFQSLSRVLDRVPMRRVTSGDDPARLPELCHAILADFHALRAAALR